MSRMAAAGGYGAKILPNGSAEDSGEIRRKRRILPV
jgi:hypothetical protein